MSRAKNSSHAYAEALLLMAESAGRVTAVESDLKAMAVAIRESPDLLRFLADSFVKPEGKQDLLAEVFSGRADPLLVMYIRILQIEGEMGNIEQISKDFTGLVAARSNRVSGEVVSAIELPDEKVKAIEKHVSEILDKDVSLCPLVDSEMLGGILVRVGDFIIDGSLDTELSRARSALSG